MRSAAYCSLGYCAVREHWLLGKIMIIFWKYSLLTIFHPWFMLWAPSQPTGRLLTPRGKLGHELA